MKSEENISYGKEPWQKLDIFLPESEKFEVFVYFHGGGLEAGDKESAKKWAEYMTKRNIAVVSAEYKKYPEAMYPEFIEDAAKAVAWVYNNINDFGTTDGIYVGGSSAGAYISMMLCFDKSYLAPYKIAPCDIDGFIHDAGQPTVHFNVLRERGLDTRRIIVDSAAPIYHVGTEESYPPMLFIVSENDMEVRYEQTLVMIAAMEHFGFSNPYVQLCIMQGKHCSYINEADENGDNLLGKIIYNYIRSIRK